MQGLSARHSGNRMGVPGGGLESMAAFGLDALDRPAASGIRRSGAAAARGLSRLNGEVLSIEQ